RATRAPRLGARAEHEAVAPRGPPDQRRSHLAPEPRAVAAAREHEAGHPEGRRADEAAADRRRDVIADGRRRGLAIGLPQEAAAERVDQRLPVLEPGRAREAVVDAALVGMPDLVDAERI